MQYYDVNPDKAPKPPSEGWIPGKALEPDSTTISPQAQMQIKDIFDLFDMDGGGSIDSNEMDAAMFALGFRPSSNRIKGESAKDIKSLSLDEFTALMKGEIMIASPLDAVWAAFSALSQSSDEIEEPTPLTEQSCRRNKLKKVPMNVVTLDGLKRACQEYDVQLSEEELQAMMAEVDTDGGGYVDRNEFMRIMYNTPWF
jgi:Ca2+-binding EF-hand superfamily protein